MKVLELTSDGKLTARTISDDGGLRKLLGGYLEVVPGVNSIIGSGQEIVMLVNEDGMRLDLPVNEVATMFAVGLSGMMFVLRGTAVFAGVCEESFCSLTDETAYALIRAYTMVEDEIEMRSKAELN